VAEPRKPNESFKTQLTRLAIFAVVLGSLWLAQRYGLIEGEPQAPSPVASSKTTPSATAVERPETTKPIAAPSVSTKPSATSSSSDPLVVRNVTLRDEDRREIYRGDIDLRPTLERIAADKRLRFSHDGTTFQNREGRLPRKPAGYYREWVVPTPGEGGPGPQRLVTGEEGDVWYTADHYTSFRRVPYKLSIFESATDR
jgi:ribonuclease T1